MQKQLGLRIEGLCEMTVFKKPIDGSAVDNSVSNARSLNRTNSANLKLHSSSVFLRNTGLPIGIFSAALGATAPAQASLQNTLPFNIIQEDQAVEVRPYNQLQNNQIEQNTLRSLQEGARRSRKTWSELERSRLEQARQQQIRFEQQQQARSLPSQLPTTSQYPADGVYLYGQQPIINQPATTYFVFESQSGSVTGALYMASSSFDCVQGQISSESIALNITNSYSQETYAYALGLNPSIAQVASRFGVSASPNIDGFHQLSVSEQDRSILATCQAQR